MEIVNSLTSTALEAASKVVHGNVIDARATPRRKAEQQIVLPSTDNASGFHERPLNLRADRGILGKGMELAKDSLAEARVGLMHAESRLLLEIDAAHRPCIGRLPLGGIDPEVESTPPNVESFDTPDRRWKIEVHAEYADHFPSRVVIRNDYAAQLCLSLQHDRKTLCVWNTGQPVPRDMWEVTYAPGHGCQHVDKLMFSLCSADAMLAGHAAAYLGVDPNEPLGGDIAGGDDAAASPRLVVTEAPQLWAFVRLSRKASGVASVVKTGVALVGVDAAAALAFAGAADAATDAAADVATGAAAGAAAGDLASGAALDGASDLGGAGERAAAATQVDVESHAGGSPDGPAAIEHDGGDGLGGGEGGGVGMGLGGAVWGALRWLLLVNALLGLSASILKCLRGCGRWLLRGFELSRPDAKLSRDGRWNFTYVQALVADPRDVNSYVWGFGGVSMPRLSPAEAEAEENGRRNGSGGRCNRGTGRELTAMALCLFFVALVTYALAVSHVAQWGLQAGFLLSWWGLYLVLVAGAVAVGNAFGTRLGVACCERGGGESADLGGIKKTAVASTALVEFGETTLRELRDLRDARQAADVAAASSGEPRPGAKGLDPSSAKGGNFTAKAKRASIAKALRGSSRGGSAAMV